MASGNAAAAIMASHNTICISSSTEADVAPFFSSPNAGVVEK